jgi:hypothetical protein
LPIAAMALGLLLPVAADALFSVLPWVSAATVLCGLMAMEGGRGARADWMAALKMLPVLSFGASALAWWAGWALGAGAEAAAWMALVAAAPVSAVAVANTAAIGLPARPTALLVLAGTLAAPLVLPLVALVFADGTPIRPTDVAARAAALVLVPAGAAFFMRRLPALTDGALLRRSDWKGIAALSLAALALARMHGVADGVAGDPLGAAWAALLGIIACGAGAAIALLVPWSSGWRGAVLAGGCKGGALAWALTAPYLPLEGHLFMALTILPIYGLPPLVASLSKPATEVDRRPAIVGGDGRVVEIAASEREFVSRPNLILTCTSELEPSQGLTLNPGHGSNH